MKKALKKIGNFIWEVISCDSELANGAVLGIAASLPLVLANQYRPYQNLPLSNGQIQRLNDACIYGNLLIAGLGIAVIAVLWKQSHTHLKTIYVGAISGLTIIGGLQAAVEHDAFRKAMDFFRQPTITSYNETLPTKPNPEANKNFLLSLTHS